MKAEANKIGSARLAEYFTELVEKKKAIALLINLLTNKDSSVRYIVADALSNLDKDSDEAINALTKLLTDKDRKVRFCAANTLKNLVIVTTE